MHILQGRGFALAIAATLAAGPFVGSAAGQLAATGFVEDGPGSWEQDEKLLPASTGAQLGFDVAIDGSTFVVGAPAANSVQAYERSADGTGELSFPNVDDNRFGKAVDVDGDLVIVGSEGDAYVFERTSAEGFKQVATLTAPEDAGDKFGIAVAIDDATNTALVGANSADTEAGENAGAAYVYRPHGGSWQLDETLTAKDASGGDQFGEALDLEGTTALVGAPSDDDATGSAYVFEGLAEGWTQMARLQPSALGGEDPFQTERRFGNDVALHGDEAVVGSQDPVFVYDDLPAVPTLEAELSPDDRVTEDGVVTGNRLAGSSVSVDLDADTVVVGAPSLTFKNGKAFVFEETSEGEWSQRTELAQRDAASYAPAHDIPSFGFSVGVADDTALVGAVQADSVDGQRDGGAAYLFSPCEADGEVSGPLHEDLGSNAGPAHEDLHDANCNVIASNGG